MSSTDQCSNKWLKNFPKPASEIIVRIVEPIKVHFKSLRSECLSQYSNINTDTFVDSESSVCFSLFIIEGDYS